MCVCVRVCVCQVAISNRLEDSVGELKQLGAQVGGMLLDGTGVRWGLGDGKRVV